MLIFCGTICQGRPTTVRRRWCFACVFFDTQTLSPTRPRDIPSTVYQIMF